MYNVTSTKFIYPQYISYTQLPYCPTKYKKKNKKIDESYRK